MAKVFRVLSSPSRIELLRMLTQGCCDGRPCCTSEELSLCIESLATRLGLVKSTVSHHLKELHDAGLIELAKRGRNNDFRVNPALLLEARHFLSELMGTCCCAPEGSKQVCDVTPTNKDANHE